MKSRDTRAHEERTENRALLTTGCGHFLLAGRSGMLHMIRALKGFRQEELTGLHPAGGEEGVFPLLCVCVCVCESEYE